MEPAASRNARLWLEFGALFLGVPLAMVLFLPPSAMFTVLGAMVMLGIILLHRTPGFAWRSLLDNAGAVRWRQYAVFALATAALSALATLWLFPERLLSLPVQAPRLWLMIMIFYPLVSALPQEILFRPLFFRRYGHLFGNGALGLVINAALFALAHVMYQSWLVLAMTFAGGLVFAWAYERRGSFMAALFLHALAGQIVFTSGLGLLFYSGAVN